MYKKLFEHERKIFSYKGRNVFDIDHSIVRFQERFPNLKDENWKKVCEDGIDLILDVFKDSSNKYIIISRSKNIAIQLEWRKDKKSKDNKNHGFTATTLDAIEHKRELQNDRKIFVEEIKKYNLEKWFNTKSYKKMIESTGYLGVKLDEECENYLIYIKEGQMYKDFEVIEVD
jgi:hypothetical protein